MQHVGIFRKDDEMEIVIVIHSFHFAKVKSFSARNFDLYVSIKYTVMQEGLWFKSDKFKNFIPRKMSNLVFLMKYSVSILVRFLFNFWIASTQHMNFFPETFKNIRLLLLNKKCIWLRRIYQKMIYSSSAKLNHVQTTLPNWIFLFLFSASLSG